MNTNYQLIIGYLKYEFQIIRMIYRIFESSYSTKSTNTKSPSSVPAAICCPLLDQATEQFSQPLKLCIFVTRVNIWHNSYRVDTDPSAFWFLKQSYFIICTASHNSLFAPINGIDGSIMDSLYISFKFQFSVCKRQNTDALNILTYYFLSGAYQRSLPAVASLAPSGRQEAHQTVSVWPVNVCIQSHSPSNSLKSFTVIS